MPLSVLSIAYPYAPVGACAVGGAEQILSELDRALVEADYTSLVIACEGSQPAGQLVPVRAWHTEAITEQQKAITEREVQQAINTVLGSHTVDLVHMHGYDFHRYRIPEGVPVLVTLHLPISWYPAEIWSSAVQRVHFCCVSQSQRRTCPPQLAEAAVIPNGVSLAAVDRETEKENFAVVLGRICPEKNQHAALDAGTRAGMPVLLGGQVFPYSAHQQYFQQQIAPRLENSQHRFLGPLGPAEKNDLLARARCLLHATVAPETSSLVAMEALAAGVPVIAFRSGALPDIIEDGITGFLVDDVEQMADAMGEVASLSPAACRRAAEQRFSRDHMVRRYFDLYDKLVHRVNMEVARA